MHIEDIFYLRLAQVLNWLNSAPPVALPGHHGVGVEAPRELSLTEANRIIENDPRAKGRVYAFHRAQPVEGG
jgi:hypothetical protein